MLVFFYFLRPTASRVITYRCLAVAGLTLTYVMLVLVKHRLQTAVYRSALYCAAIYIFFPASVDLDRLTWPTPFSRSPGFPVDNGCGHRRRRHWTSRVHDCPLSATERFPSPQHEHETVCQLKCRHQIPRKPSTPI